MSADGPATSQRQAPRVLVVVPTTGGPLLLRRLAPRPGLPHPAAFAEGHYRPLALSADYRALAGPEGPVARHLGAPLPPHELRLSGEPDGGRSWEAPVTLAHLLLAGGWSLAADGEEADLLLWATGAVDLDLRLLPGDYALTRKVEAGRALLEAQGGRRAVAVLPPGPGRDEAAAALAALRRAVPVEVVRADAVDGTLARLAADPGEPARLASALRSTPRRASPLRWAGGIGVGVAVWLLSALANGPEEAADMGLVASAGSPQGSGSRDGPAASAPDPSEATVSDLPVSDPPASDPPVSGDRRTQPTGSGPATPEPEPEPDSRADLQPSVQAPQAPDSPAAGASAALIEEVRAAPGASCRAALFDPALRALRPVPRDGAGYVALPLDPLLCGVALRPAAAGASLGPVAADPPGAFVAAPSEDGALVLFLSGAPRDVVYAVPVTAGDGPPVTVEHRLVAPIPPDASTE